MGVCSLRRRSGRIGITMKLIPRLLFVTLLAFCSSSFAQPTESPTPDALVQRTTNEVISILKTDSGIKHDRKKLFDLIESTILPHFDFARMTQLAVGRYWRRATPQQQQDIVTEFRTLLVRTYSTALTNYKDQKIEFLPLHMQPGDTDVTVRTRAIQPGGMPVPIDYTMEKTPAGWKVYDVAVDNVSLVTNYRSSFANEVRQGGIDKLIKTLQEKNQAAESTGDAGQPSPKRGKNIDCFASTAETLFSVPFEI